MRRSPTVEERDVRVAFDVLVRSLSGLAGGPFGGIDEEVAS
jgi:hypothetical protein